MRLEIGRQKGGLVGIAFNKEAHNFQMEDLQDIVMVMS